MGRSIGAVFAGMVVWSVLWIGSNAALAAAFPEIITAGQPLFHIPTLLTLIALSVVFSVAAGYVTGMTAARNAVQHAWGLGVAQLALGIFFEVSLWNLLPVWYHLVFLALLIPGNVFGGWWSQVRRLVEQPAM